MITAQQRAVRPHLGAATAALRRNPGDAELRARVEELARRFEEASLESHIRRVVDAAPPLTEAQRARLAALLQGGRA